MYETLSSLPPVEPSLASVDLTEPGKRQWETSKSGYINWAVGRLLVKGEAGEQHSVDNVEKSSREIGTGEDLRNALHAAKDRLDTLLLVSRQLARDPDGDGDVPMVDDDSRMEE